MVYQIGEVLHGFGGGWFGRDAFECKRVEAVGVDWVIARGLDSNSVYAATGKDLPERMGELSDKHCENDCAEL